MSFFRQLWLATRRPPKTSLNGLLVCGLATYSLGVATLLWLPLLPVLPIHYNLLLPLAMGWAYAMGPVLGTLPITLYLLLGFTILPLFANGGGPGYFAQPGAGYLLGLLPGAWWIGHMSQRLGHVSSGRNRFAMRLCLLLAAVLGALLLVHGTGLLYLTLLMGLKQLSWPEWQHWAMTLSAFAMAPDVVLTVAAVLTARFLRTVLWVGLYA